MAVIVADAAMDKEGASNIAERSCADITTILLALPHIALHPGFEM